MIGKEQTELLFSLSTFPIYETEALAKSITCRRHRKKRINKKLNKKYGIKKIELPGEICLVDGKIFCSRKTAIALRKLFHRGEN